MNIAGGIVYLLAIPVTIALIAAGGLIVRGLCWLLWQGWKKMTSFSEVKA